MWMEIGKLFLVVCDQNLVWSESKYSKAAFRNREFFYRYFLPEERCLYTEPFFLTAVLMSKRPSTEPVNPSGSATKLVKSSSEKKEENVSFFFFFFFFFFI